MLSYFPPQQLDGTNTNHDFLNQTIAIQPSQVSSSKTTRMSIFSLTFVFLTFCVLAAGFSPVSELQYYCEFIVFFVVFCKILRDDIFPSW